MWKIIQESSEAESEKENGANTPPPSPASEKQSEDQSSDESSSSDEDQSFLYWSPFYHVLNISPVSLGLNFLIFLSIFPFPLDIQ